MTQQDTLARIDSAIAAHEQGGTFTDRATSPDAMRWTADPETAPPQLNLWEQALADGDFRDVSELAREAGFLWPVAVTRGVWEDCVAWDEAAEAATRALQDETGRLWDVVFMASIAARRAKQAGKSCARFTLWRIARDGAPDPDEGVEPEEVELVLVAGPGPEDKPAILIHLPGEGGDVEARMLTEVDQ